jgi:hypothetical protein
MTLGSARRAPGGSGRRKNSSPALRTISVARSSDASPANGPHESRTSFGKRMRTRPLSCGPYFVSRADFAENHQFTCVRCVELDGESLIREFPAGGAEGLVFVVQSHLVLRPAIDSFGCETK